MANLRAANFDPEFYSLHEQEIVDAYNKSTGKNIVLKPKTWWINLITA